MPSIDLDLQLLQVFVDGSQHFLGDLAAGETSDHLQGHALGHADLRIGGQFRHVFVDNGTRSSVVKQFANFGVDAETHFVFLCMKFGALPPDGLIEYQAALPPLERG